MIVFETFNQIHLDTLQMNEQHNLQQIKRKQNELSIED